MLRLKSGLKDRREVLPIVTENGKTILVLLDKKEITALEINQDFKETDNYNLLRPKASFDNLLGYSIKEEDYHLFFTNNKNKRFFIQTINIADQQNRSELSEIELFDELYLESFSYANKFFILTLIDKTSILKLYEFDGNDLSKETEFDYSDFKLPEGTYFDLYLP